MPQLTSTWHDLDQDEGLAVSWSLPLMHQDAGLLQLLNYEHGMQQWRSTRSKHFLVMLTLMHTQDWRSFWRLVRRWRPALTLEQIRVIELDGFAPLSTTTIDLNIGDRHVASREHVRQLLSYPMIAHPTKYGRLIADIYCIDLVPNAVPVDKQRIVIYLPLASMVAPRGYALRNNLSFHQVTLSPTRALAHRYVQQKTICQNTTQEKVSICRQ